MAAGEAEPGVGIAVFIEEKGVHISPADGTRQDRVADLVGWRRFGHGFHLAAGGVIPAAALFSWYHVRDRVRRSPSAVRRASLTKVQAVRPEKQGRIRGGKGHNLELDFRRYRVQASRNRGGRVDTLLWGSV